MAHPNNEKDQAAAVAFRHEFASVPDGPTLDTFLEEKSGGTPEMASMIETDGPATLSVAISDIDDTGFVVINSRNVLTTQPFQQVQEEFDLPRGRHTIRVGIANGGGWAWKGTFQLMLDGKNLASETASGFGGPSIPWQKTFRITVR